MQNSLIILIVVACFGIALIGFLVYRNMKDEKEFEEGADSHDDHAHRPPQSSPDEKN